MFVTFKEFDGKTIYSYRADAIIGVYAVEGDGTYVEFYGGETIHSKTPRRAILEQLEGVEKALKEQEEEDNKVVVLFSKDKEEEGGDQ